MCKSKCVNNCKKCPTKSKEEQLELDFNAELPEMVLVGTIGHQPNRINTSALNKIVSDILNTVIMLEEEHGEELNRVLIEDKALHEKLGKVEWLLATTRQKRKAK